MTGKEQCGFVSGKVCVDQVFAMEQMSEKFIDKDKSLHGAHINLEKAYDRVIVIERQCGMSWVCME